MTQNLGVAPARLGRRAGLPERLRHETADLHARVEASTDVEGAVETVEGYIALLRGWYELHRSLEARLAVSEFRQGWSEVGVDIVAHDRSGLLAADLDNLGASPTRAKTRTDPTVGFRPALSNGFGAALGCLYVLEGSALGGRVVAQIVRSAIGEVPMTFLTGHGRLHPAPWAAVRAALRRFEARGGQGDEVVTGARETFGFFQRRLGGSELK